ncbi:MAG: dihydroxyacetone kinase transcriptional activator DhaS [Lachnospiraceae bacterium]|nr:dihydroxyacetone kinase transcriptional activator DhaS [Lachnospiraceae bacterium]
MADSNITKKALAAALKELMEEKPFEKISIGDICDRCEMNRKSFYYHFRDKYDLVNWIYDIEFIAIVSRKEYPSLWDLLQDLCTYFYENRGFYRKALRMEGQNSFSEHFREYLYPTLYACLEGSIQEKEMLDFYITFFTDAYICAIERWLLKKEPESPKKLLKGMKNCMKSFGET